MLTDEQRQIRQNGIGGSDAAAVAGISKWRSPLQVYQEKKGEPQVLTEVSEKRFYWGHVLEPIVAQEYERVTGKQCIVEAKTLIHPKYNWMIANVDRRIANENVILECKTTDAFSMHEWGEPGTDKIPTEYLLQCAHYAIVCDVEKVDLAVLIKLGDFRIYTYNRNEKLEKKLIDIEERFWNEHFLKDNPPLPISFSEAASFWEDDDSSITTDNAVWEYVDNLRMVQDQIKQLEKDREGFKLSISEYMKNASKLHDPYGRLIATWKAQTTERFDSAAFKAAHPELYKDFIKPSISRVFRLKETA